MLIFRLVLSNILTRPMRAALTIAAVALSVSLVVSVTSGYASLEGAAQTLLTRFMGSTDAQLVRVNDPRGAIAETLVERIAADPDVERILIRLELENGLVDANGKAIAGSMAQVIGIQRPRDHRVDRLEISAGGWFDGDTGDVAVVDQVAADALGAKVGDWITIPGIDRRLRLRVVGIIHKPAILAAQIQTLYVPLRTLQQFALPESPRQVNRVMIEFRENVNARAFLQRWEPRLHEIDPFVRLRLARDNRRELDRQLAGMRMISYLGGAISMVAATFIVFSALSMGVSERTRTLAMLRAVGMLRADIGALVLLEGAILGTAGALIGAPLGWFWVKLITLVPRFADLLIAGVVLSWGGLAMGIGGTLLAALAASLLPAIVAMRVSPLEAMVPLAQPSRTGPPWRWALLGLLLVAIDSTLLHAPLERLISADLARILRFYGHFALGLPGLTVGFFLIAPLFVWLAERILAPLIAPLFGLRFTLLRQQLSTGLWRAAGTAAALMVGLSVLVVMQIQGNSAIKGWRLPDRFPDIFIVRPFGGFTPAQQEKLAQVPGIKPNEIMPIAVASPELGSSIFSIAGAALLPNATMFFGIDPDKVFDLIDLDFRDGNPAQAREMLKRGRHLIVTEEFRQLKQLRVGDRLALNTPRHGIVDYTVAGVVWSPGIDVIVSLFDMDRQFEQRTVASVFGTLDDAREDFGADRVYLVAANLDYFVERDKVLADVQDRLGLMGVRAGDVRQIKYAIQSLAQKILLLASTVAFAAMIVASLGVTNTILASVRSRRWQFGIMRSIGVTRAQLLRLVLAEAALLGLVGIALGLMAGGVLTIDARAFSRHMIGYVPPVAVPWGIIWIGCGIVGTISMLASLWPAVSVARAEPLSLLQSGRAAT